MRNRAVKQIEKLAYIDDRVMMVCADLGYNVLNGFEKAFPKRFINVGIAEQNMALVAAGLALSGNIVFTYSIGNFPTLRCIEQIRNDICYHNANVKILSVGGGFAYGDLGMTHHATEDIAMMRALPNMRVYVPADPIEVVECINEAYQIDGPAYVRMAKGGEPNLHQESLEKIEGLIPIIEDTNSEVCIIASGTVLSEGIQAGDILIRKGIRVSLYSCPVVKPICIEDIVKVATHNSLIVSIEEHNIIGGLGGSISEVMAEHGVGSCSLMRIGLNDVYSSVVGDQAFLREYYGISAVKISEKVLKKIRG